MIPKFTVKNKNVAKYGKILLKLDHKEMHISSERRDWELW